MTSSLSRQQRRALQRSAEAVDHACESDRRFFRRFPDRAHRVRRMAPAEVDQLSAIVTQLEPLAVGFAWFVLMHQLAPGVRCKVFRQGPAAHSGDELSEAHAKALYDAHCREYPHVRDREADMIAAARRPGGPLHGGGHAA